MKEKYKPYKFDGFDIEVKIIHERVDMFMLPIYRQIPRRGKPKPEWLVNCDSIVHGTFNPCGGRTTCTVSIIDHNPGAPGVVSLGFSGIATCSMSDNYNKTTGALMAMERCLETAYDYSDGVLGAAAIRHAMSKVDIMRSNILARGLSKEVARHERATANARDEIVRLSKVYGKLAKTKPTEAENVKRRIADLQKLYNVPFGG